MNIYRTSSSDFSGVDDLLDFSNDHGDVLCASATDNLSSTTSTHHFHYGANDNHNHTVTNYHHHHHSMDFTDHLSVPSDDVAELEWLSNFVYDSFSNFPANNMAGTINYLPDNNTSFHSRSRTRSAPTHNTTWTSSTPSPTHTPTIYSKTTMKLETYSPLDKSSETETVRRCTHCASEKTPQWRTGPLGPKTLCNACGVRYKSGRLVPEYRPAASPTFVLTQHSNSHRKVMELRRQKEMMLHPQPPSEYQLYGGGHHHHNRNNYEVC